MSEPRDVSNDPVTRAELFQVVESVCRQVNETVTALVRSMNAALEARGVELVAGPTSVKRVSRDENGLVETIEEYGTLVSEP